MNKKTKIIIVSTLAAVLAVSGGIVFNSRQEVSAAEPAATTGQAKHKPDKEAPPREAGRDRGTAGKGEKKDRPRNGGPSAGANPSTSTSPTNSGSSEQGAISVVISGGFDTFPDDHGRPVVLIAAALGVPTEVFREAFSGVTPAGLDGPPSSELAGRNKAALMKVLSPYGITNDRLDEVSNYYRYNGSKGETWPITQASATATVTNGVVTDITITNPGAGYTSSPTVTVTGPNGTVTATATLSYSKDFKTNGSLSAITVN